MFSGWLNWINVPAAGLLPLADRRAEGDARRTAATLWLLVGLSFAYGVFHAAGPGHGKAVISSYMLANEVALRRGVMLSFVSAFLQALTAILVMALVFLVLRGTAVSMTDATWFLEVASYVLITLFGAWLLWQKAGARLRRRCSAPTRRTACRPRMRIRHAHGHGHAHAHGHAHSHAEAHSRSRITIIAHHGHDHAFATRMRTRIRTPGSRSARRAATAMRRIRRCCRATASTGSTAWSAVVAVGLRPCSGALIVLTFAFLNGLWVGGVLSVFAMAVGTAITVSALATLAVTAKNWAVAYAGDGRAGNRVHATIEIGGAALVFVLGLLLLSASLAA